MKDSIARSSQLADGGRAIRFNVIREGATSMPAIAIRYDGVVYAYLNSCVHMGLELDIREGDVFSHGGETLICAAHGAEYHPRDGACVGGPCFGEPLTGLAIYEENGRIYLRDSAFTIA